MATLITETTACGTRRCDARCYNAKGPDCRCCCGGRHHGQGLRRAVEASREWAAERGLELPAVQMNLEYLNGGSMETVYVAVFTTRVAGTSVYAFSAADPAISWAAEQARKFDRFDDLREQQPTLMPPFGMIYRAEWGESDHIEIEAVRVDKELT